MNWNEIYERLDLLSHWIEEVNDCRVKNELLFINIKNWDDDVRTEIERSRVDSLRKTGSGILPYQSYNIPNRPYSYNQMRSWEDFDTWYEKRAGKSTVKDWLADATKESSNLNEKIQKLVGRLLALDIRETIEDLMYADIKTIEE
jgi:hypothetical protein